MSVDVTPVQYRPHDEVYRLDVEVLDAAELRRRVASDPTRGFERVDFLCLLFVRSGTYTHTIDFETHRCAAGSCLLIRPGQVHRFGEATDWDGWILVTAPHHVPEEIDGLPPHVVVGSEAAAACAETFTRMTADVAAVADLAHLDGLLALQARVVLKRLVVGNDRAEVGDRTVDRVTAGRFRAFRNAVEEHFRQWHQVAPYARQLGCSTKTLNRACQAIGAQTAKRVIVARVVLEAKRLLAHSADPVATISEDLGFDEATNFVKYFKRETGVTPAQFRGNLPGAG